ncbi:MAG: hypothetical protein KJ944_06990 [Alphaproteobacteria bacterium]|nr:hypothetical protein [Alphaproteobacteria bacterium]MBU1560026.1 hypothetical protein [Alphaproteobacteria bacterium]MBU2302328.1 hypothetical protein [Alphaproteobacteria bacterium]MBU2369398.1 hypothetical protein [Alphaproteobacteria bacterium]
MTIHLIGDATLLELERHRSEARASSREAAQPDMFLDADIDAAASAEEIASLLSPKKKRHSRRTRRSAPDNAADQQLEFPFSVEAVEAVDLEVSAFSVEDRAPCARPRRVCELRTDVGPWRIDAIDFGARPQRAPARCRLVRKGGLIPLARSDIIPIDDARFSLIR